MTRLSIAKALTLTTALLLLPLSATAQRFFNLTADEVRIDSLLPRFTYSIPLGDRYADSTYTVEIKYPEYIDMTRSDMQRYQALTAKPLPSKVTVDTRIVTERKKGKLEVELSPLLTVNGKAKMLVSFMLDVKAQAKKRSVRKAIMKSEAAMPERYAAHSVLAEGRWTKIRVPATGVYNLSNSFLQGCGFSNPDKVKVYGYGGNLQNEQLVAEELMETDDLKEKTMVMGCYGIGISRTLQAVIEQSHDKDGIIWPSAVAPYQVVIDLLDPADESVANVAAALEAQLEEKGVDVIVDDREERPGVKFKDADLIGFTVRVVVGAKGLAKGGVEIKARKDPKEAMKIVPPAEAPAAILELLASC